MHKEGEVVGALEVVVEVAVVVAIEGEAVEAVTELEEAEVVIEGIEVDMGGIMVVIDAIDIAVIGEVIGMEHMED